MQKLQQSQGYYTADDLNL